jgi:hypothetical protein
MNITNRVVVLAVIVGACSTTLARADEAGASNDDDAGQANRQDSARRYGRLVDILSDLDHLLITAPLHFQAGIDNAIKQWNPIAEKTPREAQAYDPAFQTYRDMYREIKVGNDKMASTLRVRALGLRNQAALELEKEYRAEDYGTPDNTPQNPRPPLQGGIDEKVSNPGTPQYNNGTNYYDYKFKSSPLPGTGNSRPPMQAKVVRGDSELAWAPWHKRIADGIFRLFADEVKYQERNKGVLWPTKACIIKYRVTKILDSPEIYRVAVVRVTQKSGDDSFDRLAEQAIGYMDNYGRSPGMAFPPGSTRRFMDKTAEFKYGEAKLVYSKKGQQDKEVIRR